MVSVNSFRNPIDFLLHRVETTPDAIALIANEKKLKMIWTQNWVKSIG